MTTLLQINSSLHGDDGQSSQLTNDFVRQWQARVPDAAVIRRDLARDPVPHLTAERFAAFGTSADERSPAQAADVALSDTLIAELQAADVIVLGLPMYNFQVPSTLKAYFDHVARAGITFRYTSDGPVGLLSGKRAVVFTTRGGRYLDTPKDTQTGYVRNFLGFIGITDVTFVHAEGLAKGGEPREQSLEHARTQGTQLVERLAARLAA